MKPRVSVLMAARDAAGTIEASLRSLQRQSLSDWEVLVVDDGSQDDTASRVQALVTQDPRIRLLRTSAKGVVAARNLAAEEARGEAVAILDADDLAHRLRLQLQWDQLQRQGGGVVSCFARYFRSEAVGPGLERYQQWLRRQDDGAAVQRARFIEMPYAHSALMLSYGLGESVGWYQDYGWPEDYDLALRLAASGSSHGVVPRILVAWRVREGSASRTEPRYSLSAFTRCRAAALARDYLTAENPWLLWGHGATGKALRQALASHGYSPTAILEVDSRKIGQRIEGIPVINALSWLNEDDADHQLVVSVSGSIARQKIRESLASTGRIEGEGFFFAA